MEGITKIIMGDEILYVNNEYKEEMLMNTKITGYLKLNDRGRYEIKNNELSSGYPIEIFDGDKWIKGRIEHKWNHGYYLFANDGKHIMHIDGLLGRIEK